MACGAATLASPGKRYSISGFRNADMSAKYENISHAKSAALETPSELL